MLSPSLCWNTEHAAWFLEGSQLSEKKLVFGQRQYTLGFHGVKMGFSPEGQRLPLEPHVLSRVFEPVSFFPPMVN